MKLNKDSLTAIGQGIGVDLHVKPDTPVFADRNESGHLILHIGPVTLYFRTGQEVELRNLLSHHTENGTDITRTEALWIYDEVSDSKSFTQQHPQLVERLRIVSGVAED